MMLQMEEKNTELGRVKTELESRVAMLTTDLEHEKSRVAMMKVDHESQLADKIKEIERLTQMQADYQNQSRTGSDSLR